MKKNKKEIKQISKFMAAVGMFGINCGRRHKHGNAFCDTDCCKDWRAENPNQGRANHKHDPKTGLVLVNGVELV